MKKMHGALIPAVALSLTCMAFCCLAAETAIDVSIAPYIKDPITFSNVRVSQEPPIYFANLIGEIVYPRSSCEDLQVSAELIGDNDKVLKSVSILLIPYRKGSVTSFKTGLPIEFHARPGKTPPTIRKLSVFEVKCF